MRKLDSWLANTNFDPNNLFINKTYSELSAMASANSLSPGQKFKITDYQTVHTIPNTADTNTGAIEPLIVTALDSNSLKPIAFSETFPQDIIYYSLANDAAVVSGSTKGYIYRRIDTVRNNDIGFDFRNVKFRRWQIEVTLEDTDGNDFNYTKGQAIKKTSNNEVYIKLNDETNKLFTDASSWKRFEWDNLMYVSYSLLDWYIIDDTFSILIPTNTNYMDYKMFTTAATIAGVESSYSSIYNNFVEQNIFDIIANSNTVQFGANFSNNSIGANFYNNSIGSYFSYNSIGANFYNNSIGSSFYNNSIGANFYNNSIGSSCFNNSIGAGFASNSIGVSFASNSIGANFASNSIGASFYNNSIGSIFSNNTIGSSFTSNSIGTNFYDNRMILAVPINCVIAPGVSTHILTSAGATELASAYTKWIAVNSASALNCYYYNSSNVQTFITIV